MAVVTITITDVGPDATLVRVESDPPLPLDGQGLDVDAATPAQAAAVYAAQALQDASAGGPTLTVPPADG